MRKINIEVLKEPVEATLQAMLKLSEEESKNEANVKNDLEKSVYTLNDLCNEYGKVIAFTENLSELRQAIITTKKLFKFYEGFNEPILNDGLVRLAEAIKEGEERIEILSASKIDMSRKYEITDSSKLLILEKTFEICEDEIFNCDFKTFKSCIEKAKFEDEYVIKKSAVQDLVFRLKSRIGEEWYAAILKNMDWTNKVCSGRVLSIKWNAEIEKILPMKGKARKY